MNFATDEFPWKKIGRDDYMCVLDHFTLRVEKMRDGVWWWEVSIKGNPLPKHVESFTSAQRVIGFCEGYYSGMETVKKWLNEPVQI